MVALLSGQVHLLFNSMIQGMQYARSGKLTAIGTTSAKRSPAMPELPSIAESGLPGYDFSMWYALLTHANVPKPALARHHAETVKALGQPDFKARLAKSGIETGGASPAESTAYVASEMAKWDKVVKSSGMKVDRDVLRSAACLAVAVLDAHLPSSLARWRGWWPMRLL